MRAVGAPQHYLLAMEPSARHKQHLFDTLYHALALGIPGATLVTVDTRYANKARDEGHVMLLRGLTLAE
jgi:hypothetical protein